MNEKSSELKNTSSQQNYFLSELLRFALIAIVIVIPIRLFIAQPFIVSGSSMDPTFHDGEYLIVDELSYRFESPERGDVVVFKFPNNTKRFLIKRIVGLPGETVNIRNGIVSVVDIQGIESQTLEEEYVTYKSNETITTKLGDEEYFVAGDNRVASSDSRSWGVLNEKFLVGRAFLRLLPVTKVSFLPGDIK
jgi:signal peptidase I